MRNLRPALLAMLLAAAGLGVPACFAQSASGKSSSKRKTPANSTSPKRPGGRASSAKSSPGRKSLAPSSSSARASRSASQGTASRSVTKKSASSKRSRRQPGQKAPTSDRVSEIQAALAKDGSFAGTPTGKWDDSTSEAMRKFQAGHKLNPTGKLDAPTLQKLGLGSQTAGVAAPTPPPGAVSRLTSSNSFSSSAESSRQP